MIGLSSCIVCEPITVFDRTVHESHACVYTRRSRYTQHSGTHKPAYARVFEPETGRSSKSVSRSVRGAIVLDRISGRHVTLTTNQSCSHLVPGDLSILILKNSAFVKKRAWDKRVERNAKCQRSTDTL